MATEIFEIAGAIILSLGGSSVLIIVLSSWLGKVWANRILEKDRAKFAHDLEEFKANLEHNNQTELSSIKTELDIYKEKHLKGHSDKILIYRLVADIVTEFLGDMDYIYGAVQLPPNTQERFDKFNRDRMKAYAYLAMLAPQNVMDAFDNLIDHLLSLKNGEVPYEWLRVRNLSLVFINEVRKDVGIDTSSIEYRGKR